MSGITSHASTTQHLTSSGSYGQAPEVVFPLYFAQVDVLTQMPWSFHSPVALLPVQCPLRAAKEPKGNSKIIVWTRRIVSQAFKCRQISIVILGFQLLFKNKKGVNRACSDQRPHGNNRHVMD